MSPEETKVVGLLVAGASTVGITGIIAWAAVKLRGPARPSARPGELAALDERLDRLEHAVDAVALEIERGGEAQRFTARLLAERLAADGGGARGDVPRGDVPSPASRAAER
jgi:hypothetical protein